MAKASSIGRLHMTELEGAGGESPEQLPANLPDAASTSNCNGLFPTERRVRGKFVLASTQPESYTLPPEIMSTMMQSSGPLDRTRDFELLAARERLERMVKNFCRPEWQDGQSRRAPVPLLHPVDRRT